MVYKRNNLKVLLGPETLAQNNGGEYHSADEILYSAPGLRSRNLDQSGFGKIGETSVYKRTRPAQGIQPKPRLERYPSGLQLAGRKVDSSEESSAKSARSTQSGRRLPNQSRSETDNGEEAVERSSPVSKDSNMPSEASSSNYSQSLTRGSKPGRGQYSASNVVSRNYLTDFGLRTERTDTFSGHHRRRAVASAEMERQMEEKAKRHIRTCQTFGNMKRSSKVQLGYQGLRAAVSPSYIPTSMGSREGSFRLYKDKAFYGSKPEVNVDETEVGSYMIQLRKHIGSISKTKTIAQGYKRTSRVPEITGRTLIVGTGYT